MTKAQNLTKLFPEAPEIFAPEAAQQQDFLYDEPANRVKVYIFGTVAAAEAFKMTAFAFGYDAPQVRQVGSALVMPEFVYATVTDKTYAIPAAMVCEECE